MYSWSYPWKNTHTKVLSKPGWVLHFLAGGVGECWESSAVDGDDGGGGLLEVVGG